MSRNNAGAERIHTLLQATSRTFALSIEGLSQRLRDQIAVSYLLLRVSDYLEDHEELPAEEKIRLLGIWEATLAQPSLKDRFVGELSRVPHRPDDPEAEVAFECGLLLDTLGSFPARVAEIIVHRVRETTRGMASWQARGPRVETEDQLDDYMHHVAGLVGYLVTELFAAHFGSIAERRVRLMPLAHEFGLALQTVNVLRGLRKDYDRGWVFVPQAFCAAYGLALADLFRPSERGRAMHVVADLIEKAEQHLRSGLEYVRIIPRRFHRVRLACMWPLLFAAQTLAVSRNNPAVLAGEVKIDRPSIRRIIRDTTLFGWSNTWLSSYAARLLTAPA